MKLIEFKITIEVDKSIDELEDGGGFKELENQVIHMGELIKQSTDFEKEIISIKIKAVRWIS